MRAAPIIVALKRSVREKQNAKHIRSDGYIPALLIKKDEPISILIKKELIERFFQHHKNQTQIIRVALKNKIYTAVLIASQHQSFREEVGHLSFVVTEKHRPQKVKVAVRIAKQEKRQSAFIILITKREVELVCLPDCIPSFLTANPTSVSPTSKIRVSDLLLPKGTKLSETEKKNNSILVRKIPIQKESTAVEKKLEAKRGAESSKEKPSTKEQTSGLPSSTKKKIS
ncbi:50S ribosomal subunit protein L25 [Candidatus Tremblaya phenacola PAVE]|nr:50S ribosomal subunit protein L25 [Candidatus Tremblaya phenacola PAVE]